MDASPVDALSIVVVVNRIHGSYGKCIPLKGSELEEGRNRTSSPVINAARHFGELFAQSNAHHEEVNEATRAA